MPPGANQIRQHEPHAEDAAALPGGDLPDLGDDRPRQFGGHERDQDIGEIPGHRGIAEEDGERAGEDQEREQAEHGAEGDIARESEGVVGPAAQGDLPRHREGHMPAADADEILVEPVVVGDGPGWTSGAARRKDGGWRGTKGEARMTQDRGRAPRERCWEVDGLRLAGLDWGPETGMPVLALHGWMDHAGSFAELAPRLAGCRVVALDLSGQGLSGNRAAHASYNIWDDLPQIAGLLDALGWTDCVLLGHSRGANIAALLAAALPERVRALVAIESLVPAPKPEDEVVASLRGFVEGARRQQGRPPRRFASRAAYVERRRAQGNSRRVAEALAERALEAGPEGLRLRGDGRLFASSALRLSSGQVEAVLRAIRAPVLNVWASGGIAADRPAMGELIRRAEATVPIYERLDLEGDHHLHLEPGAAAAIARAALDFLDRRGAR